MKSVHVRLSLMGLFAVALLGSYSTEAAEPQPLKDLPAFGVLRTPALETARDQAQQWLKSTGKFDEAAFQLIWSQSDRPILDLVTDTLALGNADAKKLLADASNADTPAPKAVPDLIKDTKVPTYLRANLALAYGRALANRKVYEEALGALVVVRPEQVVDPGAFYFYKAMAEHGMNQKEDAFRTVLHLIDEVPDAPQRYRTVAALMLLDMDNWQKKGLDDISRKMANIGRRLDLGRGGPVTQKQQKEVVARLDEKIKELENKQKGGGGGGGGGGEPGCPPGAQPGQQGGQAAGAPTQPQQDSFGGQNSGPGRANDKKWLEQVEAWGKLPERERAKAMTEMIRNMPPAYQRMIEEYFKRGAGQGTLP